MSKTAQSKTTPSWTPDPDALRQTARDAATASVDGLLDLQKELHTAALSAWEQGKKELERAAAAQDKAFREGLDANHQAMQKALGWWKEQIERTGAAPRGEA
jgi:hypothetical protein